MYQDILRTKFVLEVKCIECDESEEQEPLKIFKAVGLPRWYVDGLWMFAISGKHLHSTSLSQIFLHRTLECYWWLENRPREEVICLRYKTSVLWRCQEISCLLALCHSLHCASLCCPMCLTAQGASLKLAGHGLQIQDQRGGKRHNPHWLIKRL